MVVRYLAPGEVGKGTGLTAEDAASVAKLDSMIKAVGPGGTVLLRADLGPYAIRDELRVTTGGKPREVVTVRGAGPGGTPAPCELVGTRAAPYDPKGTPGGEVFRLGSGASYLRFSHLAFVNQGNGCFRNATPLHDITVSQCTARNVRRFFENAGTANGKAGIDGLVIEKVDVRGFSKGVVRLSGDTRNVRISDVTGDSEGQDKDNFAIGIHLQEGVSDVLVERVTIRNCVDTLKPYWNGDGFATERETANIRFVECVAADCTDGGFDLKTGGVVLERCRAIGNKRNYRLWGRDSVLRECASEAPLKRGGSGSQSHIWVADGGAVLASRCSFSDKAPDTVLFELEDGATLDLELRMGALSKHPDSLFWKGAHTGRVLFVSG